VFGKDVLWIGDNARLDTTVFARLGKSQLPPRSPRSPRLLLLEPGMFRRSRIIECVDDCLCEGFVRRGVTNGLCRGGDGRGDGRGRPGYLICGCVKKKKEKGNMRAASENRRYGRTHTARASSLSSIVLSASETASPTLTPRFFSSSAAARNRGFSLILDVSYEVKYPHPINNSRKKNTGAQNATHPSMLIRGSGLSHRFGVLELIHVTL
jgi:hypothetical protein